MHRPLNYRHSTQTMQRTAMSRQRPARIPKIAKKDPTQQLPTSDLELPLPTTLTSDVDIANDDFSHDIRGCPPAEGSFGAKQDGSHTRSDILFAIDDDDIIHNSLLLPPGANIDPDIVMTSSSTDKVEVAQLKNIQQAAFGSFTCPKLQMSSFVQKALNKDEAGLRDYLTRLPSQRDPDLPTIHYNGAKFHTEYDFVHFKTDTVGEVYSRQALHYEIAYAIRKQSAAEKKIRKDGYNVLYAVNDAQLVLLLEHLQERGDYYTVHYDPSEINMVQRREQDAETGEIEVRMQPKLGRGNYMRQITDESIVRAFKALTAPRIMFCVARPVPMEISPEESKEAQDKMELNNEVASMQIPNPTEDKEPEKKRTKLNKAAKEEIEKKEAEAAAKAKAEARRKYYFLPYQACAFFEDKDYRGDLTFDTEISYFDLPFDQMPTQPESLIREEAYENMGWGPGVAGDDLGATRARIAS